MYQNRNGIQGNSSPVGRAESAETEAHQDVFELRFDHLALGGTAVIVIIIGCGLYCLYRQRRKRKYRHCKHQDRRQSRSQSREFQQHPACCHGQHGFPMMPYPPFSMPILPPGHQASSWIPMDMFRQPTPIYDSPRFSEIQETAAVRSDPPTRPPPLKNCLPRTWISQKKNQLNHI